VLHERGAIEGAKSGWPNSVELGDAAAMNHLGGRQEDRSDLDRADARLRLGGWLDDTRATSALAFVLRQRADCQKLSGGSSALQNSETLTR
jgi:hypothetical protein